MCTLSLRSRACSACLTNSPKRYLYKVKLYRREKIPKYIIANVWWWTVQMWELKTRLGTNKNYNSGVEATHVLKIYCLRRTCQCTTLTIDSFRNIQNPLWLADIGDRNCTLLDNTRGRYIQYIIWGNADYCGRRDVDGWRWVPTGVCYFQVYYIIEPFCFKWEQLANHNKIVLIHPLWQQKIEFPKS